MSNSHHAISSFIHAALKKGLIHSTDTTYLQNRLIALLQLDSYTQTTVDNAVDMLDSLDRMSEYAREKGIIDKSQSQQEQFEAAIMDLITPMPHALNQTFWGKHVDSPKEATDYFYQLSQHNDYIKTRQIAKNIHFTTPSTYGELEITINLSKPEKDPEEIKQALTRAPSTYPQCVLCMENEGYQGHVSHPARQNHRIIQFDLNGDAFGLQYSPYVYYNEHAIFLNKEHKPMKVDQRCFEHLLELVHLFPHYFAGSNADLPIVGGSILSHDHYQGGQYTFPMDKATVYQPITLKHYPELKAGLLNWPLSVIRLKHPDRKQLVEAATAILRNWQNYSDESLAILAKSNHEPHNTITPIARKIGQDYQLDLVLRNNRTSERYPQGIFHPHPDVQHIKKENIGLIEVMGLAILPPRLEHELKTIKDYIQDRSTIGDINPAHQEWATELKKNHMANIDLDRYIEEALGMKFERVLEDSGVFKMDTAGRDGFNRFIAFVNHEGTK